MSIKAVLVNLVLPIVIVIGSGFYLVVIPEQSFDAAYNEKSKKDMEIYLSDRGLSDFAIGSDEWNYYVGVVDPAANNYARQILVEEGFRRSIHWAVILFVISLLPFWGYSFSLIFNSLLILLIAIGYGGWTFLIPVFSFSIGVYARKSLLASLRK